MEIEKQGSKGGNYGGGFLHMFDWNAKSRKKLFSSKFDVPEQSKQKKLFDGNLPSSRIQMLEVDEITAISSVKESSDYSCSSSLVDEDFYGTRAPGVVARLMGLDSLPKSTPLFDSQSLLHESSCYYHQANNLEYRRQDQILTNSGNLHDLPARNDVLYPNYHRNVMNRPIKKFQTEILPPKSAKSIPITHHKLLSPIKSANFTQVKDPAQIMEAAARIIEPRRRTSSVKAKLPPVGSSSSIPLRVVDFKEKVRLARKPSEVYEGSQRKPESQSAVKNNNNSNNNKGKSISLALQAKANVQKREGMNVSSSRSQVSPKEPCEPRPNNNSSFKSQPATQKNTLKKNYTQNGPSVLRQNNQKQNCIVERGKMPAKCNSKGPKSKLDSTLSKFSYKKLGPEIKDDKSKVPSSSSSSERVINRKKRSVNGNIYHCEKNQPVKLSGKTDRLISSDHQDRGTDVISFTFTAPMMRSGPGLVDPTECKLFSAGSESKRSGLGSDGTSGSRFSYAGHNSMKGGDALSTLLEQKLKELAQKVEFSQQKSGSTELEGDDKHTDEMEIDNLAGVLEESSMFVSSISQAVKSLDCWLPSPVSVLELSSLAESCNSSDTAESNCMRDTKLCSSAHAQELLDSFSSKMFLTTEGEFEFSDSALSNSTNSGKSKKWELEYMNEILSNVEPMFEDYYASGQAGGVLKSNLFDKLECQKGYLSDLGEVSRIDKRLMFDCASECLDLRCKQYVSGGFKQWAKGISVIRRKEKLAEEVCEEILSWSAPGDSMIDELVDKDMSGQYGKWVDYEIETYELGIQIESRVLNSLIDEMVADILVL